VSVFLEILDPQSGLFYNFSAFDAPSEYEPVWNDIVDAERAVDGTLRYEGIVSKDKLVISWNFMSQSAYQTLSRLTSLRIFRVRYYSPRTGGIKTANMYIGSDQKLTCLGQWNGDRFAGYKVSVSFVEE